MMLNIGCGDVAIEGSIGLDVRRTSCVHVLADARMLPFKGDSFSKVFSSHLIEHFSHKEVEPSLREWTRVLKKNGKIEIRCPDLRARAFLFFISPSWANVRKIYGEQDYYGNQHKCGFSFVLLKALLKSCGIRDVKRIFGGYKGIPFVPNCLHIVGTKS